MLVDGVSPRMADMATVLSVKEYTNRRPSQSGLQWVVAAWCR